MTLRFRGIPIRYVSAVENGGAPAAINPDNNMENEDASLTMDISAADWLPMIETARATGGEAAANRLFDAVLGEEVIHGADHVAANEEYDALSPFEKKAYQNRGAQDGRTGRFRFKQERYTKIIEEGRRLARAASKKDAKAIAQLFINAYNTYVVPFEEETRGRKGFFAREGRESDIFNTCEPTGAAKGLISRRGWLAMGELLRQAKQMQQNGDITEATHAAIFDKIGSLYKKIINGLKRSLKALTGTGRLPAIDKILDDIDKVLAGDPVVDRQSSVQSIEYGTKAFNEHVGATTITIGPDGKHYALYSYGPTAFGDGLGFRFEPEKKARRIADIDTARGGYAAFAPMPVWVRAEKPAMVDLQPIMRNGGWTSHYYSGVCAQWDFASTGYWSDTKQCRA
jgi:hypothetical protein